MEIQIIDKKGNKARFIETEFIPRVGETIVFEEFDEMEKECVVKDVTYYIDEHDDLENIMLFVEYV